MKKNELQEIIIKMRIKYKNDRDGNGFYEELITEMSRIVDSERITVVNFINDWLNDLSDPIFYHGIDLIGDLKLVELKEKLKIVRKRIIEETTENKVSKLQCIDRTLAKL